jgi:Asp/Glu/hydantoin racemase
MAFITLPHWEKKVERIISMYGIRDLVLPHKPCRPFSISIDDFKDENRVLDNFVETARGAIHDGADVVVLACVNCSTFLTHKGIGDIDGIPLVDGAIAALKMAEVMVDFKRAGFWRSKKTIPMDIKEGLRKGYYHGVESI